MRGKFTFKRQLTLLLAIMMLLTAVPVNLLAQSVSDDNYSIRYNDNILRREDYINKVNKLPLIAAKPDEGQTSKAFAENPKQPMRYTVRADFKVERGDDYVVSYQPYVATVGEAASVEEKAKVDKELNFPVFDGYTSATKKTKVDYNFVKDRATKGKEIKDPDLGIEQKGPFEAIYKPIESTVLVKHVFQDFENPEIYKEKPGDEPGHFRETTQSGLTGTSLKIQPLSDYEIEGYVPESNDIRTQVPENPKNFEVEFRYNRASYDLIYDTDGGTLIPARRVYFKQVVPTLEASEIPRKNGAEFIGWTASHDIITKDGTKTYKKDEIISDASGKAIKNLDANLLVPALRLGNNKRPAEKLVFKAAWKNNPTADYAVQFWVEKADHADNAPLLNKYDFMGTRVYKNATTGSRPNLDKESVGPVNKELNGVTNTFPGLNFPDLNEARLKKIWKGEKFYAGQYLYLNKFFVYNKELTDELNYEPIDPNNINAERKIKEVMSDGRTVYNIYYDRQVYDLYFTKSNALGSGETFYPEIYVPDGNGGAKLAGGPGNPYHYKARFNELMLGWPNDAMQTKGFDPGKQSYGWGPNYGEPHWPTHLDTPPYRLNADEFLDMPNYESWGGYVSQIDNGAGGYITASDFRTLSFGIKQEGGSMPHHMDFWMDGFKDGETIIRYDLYRSKADTNDLTYNHRYTQVQGFTPKGSTIEEGSEENGRITEDDIDTLNDERGEITPYPDKEYTDIFGFNNALGQMHFRAAFFNNADGFGDPLDGNSFETNGYIRFKYYRNKYPLRFNFDPSITRDDSYFKSTNKLDTFYEFPLKVLSPNLVKDNLPREKKEYFKKNPDNFLDKPNNLFKLGLTDLLQKDPDDSSKFAQETIKFKNPVTNKEENYTTYKVRRPEGLSPQMEFKGWALDPAGTKLIWQLKGETMPSHPLNLYAKWGEPDYKWKITFDPNEGKMPDLIPKTITKEEKTIKEGDIGLEKEVTYPKAGYKDENGKETPATVDGKKIFTVVQRQKLVPPEIPTREGYEFMGWELVRFKKDEDGKLILDNNGKPVIDTSYRDKYKVPELYAFENDVVSDLYLRAIWNKNDLINIIAYHHFLDKDYQEESMQKQILKNRRVGSYVGAVGSRQDASRILVPKDEWDMLEENNTTKIAESMTYKDYKKLDPNNPRVNSYYQQIVVQPLKKEDKATGQLVPNPEAKYNVFHYYYRPFRKREYKVNYVDARAKDKIETIFEMDALKKEIPELGIKIKRTRDKDEKKKLEDIKAKKEERLEKLKEIKPTENLETLTNNYAIIDKETVTNGNRDFDARNYRHIPGWKLVGKPQQQIFFDVNEETNELLGINGTGMDEIYFFYQDIRVIESKKGDPVPDGYARITYKIDDKNKGGTFVDKDGKKVTELYYDVVRGLRSDNLDAITPKVWVDGEKNLDGTEKTKEEGKFYITADNGKNFIKWDKIPLLNKDTVIEQNYTFTAYFDWSDLKVSAKGMATTESFEDTNTIKGSKIANIAGKDWSNKFAPTIDDLKKQLVLTVNKKQQTDIDKYLQVKFTDADGNELKTDGAVIKLINEKRKTDTQELVRTVNIKALVKFKEDYVIATEESIKDKISPIEEEAKEKEAAIEKETEETISNLEKEKTKEKEALEAKLKTLKEASEQNKAEIAKTEKAIANLEKEKAKEKEALEAKLKTLKEASEPNEAEITKTEKAIANLEKEKAKEKEELEAKLKTLKGASEQNKAEIAKIEDEIRALIKETEETISNLEREKAAKEATLAAETEEKIKEEINKIKDEKVLAKEALEDKLKTLKKASEQNKAEIAKTEKAIANLLKEINIITNYNNTSADFTDDASTQKLDIPVKVYKNVYEALTNGEMPKVLKDATDDSTNPQGDLVHVTGNYVKVTVAPTGNLTNKDNKIYYVNPKAWVEIPEVSIENDEKTGTGFIKWAANQDEQNEVGIYDFAKRHKFTKDTVISPIFSDEVVEQTDPAKKPDVPDTFVKVIVKTTDKATDDTAFEKTFWVNPTKEVTIPVTNPTGKTVEADHTKPGTLGYTMNFDKWTSNETTPRTWEDKIVGKFEKETTIEAKYSINFENIKDIAPKTDTVHTAKGKTPTVDEIKDKLTPPEGKTIKEVKIVQNPDVNTEGPAKVKVKVEYTDGSSVGTDTDPIEIPVEVHKNIIPEAPGGERPKDALDNYVKVILKAGVGGKFENTLTNQFVYYVSPDVEADMTQEANKIQKTPDTGYIVNGGTWTPEIKSEKITADKTYEFNFNKSIDIVEKTPQVTKVPDGYVTVTFKAEENGKYGKLEGDIVEKVYYVNPKAGIKLGKTAAAKVIQVPGTTPAKNYVFDKWFEAIDEDTPITSDRIHVAKFKSDKVTLAYDAGGADGTAPISAIVDYGTSVRLASPDGLTKADAKFLGWKLDGEEKIYKPGELVKLENSRTATAQWESDKPIIEYTQDNPKTRPDGYVRVSFVADNGLKLTDVKYYYVKKNAKDEHGNAITLEKLTKPTVTPETGYKSIGWDKNDNEEIKDQDITVKALSEGLKDAIEKTPQVTKAPSGYVEVKFVAGPNGTVDEKTYFVNPNKYVSLTPPTATGKTGYEFNTWSSNKMGDFSLTNYIRYTENTEIIAKFNQKDSVFPKKDGFTPPANYVEVNFEVDPACRTCGKLEGITTYYVDPNREVSIPKPNTVAGTGYIFDKWIVKTGQNQSDDFKPAENHKYTEATTTIYVSFKKLDDIVPLEKNQTEINLQPEGYVKVVFMKGSHANKMEGNSVYYVNPKANKTMGDPAIIRPRITPDVGWKQKSDDEAWKILDTIAVTNNTAITEDLYIIAQYKAIPDYIEKTDPSQTAPNGYVEVKFIPGKNGKLKDTSGTEITEKIYFVNPSKYVVLPEPDVDPNPRYEFASWDQDNGSYTKGYTQYTKNTVIKARFNPAKKVIPANTITSKPANYVEVKFALENVNANVAGTFKAGEVLSYYVEKDVTVKISPPEININPGYKFDKWIIKDNQSEQEIKPQNDNTYADDITIYGKFDTFPDVIPSKTPIGDVNPKPQGYVTVTFDKGENGVLDGQTVFYVKPNAGIKLGNSIIEKPNVFAANSYSFSGWDVTGDNTAEDKSTIDNFLIKDANITVKAIYTKMPPIIKAGPEQTAPAGYVVIIFKTDGKGKLLDNAVENNSTIDPESKDQESEIVYFVDPNRKLSADHDVRLVNENVPVSYTALPIPSPVPNDNKRTKFDRWVEEINYTDPIKRGRVYVATFKPNEVSLTYEANGATGDVPAVTTVDYGKTLRLAGPGNLKKDNASFAGWMIDGIGLKQVGDEITLEESKKAIAKWTDDAQIIEYDPINKPMTKPDDTYLRVSFTSDDGITLNETKAYYVKKNTKLSDLTMPKYSVNTGYDFKEWTPNNITEITQDNTVFKATSTLIADTIEKTNANPKAPSGYVEVTFKADNSGNGTVEEKTYFVNPNKYVTLTPPTAKGNTGYEFGAWSDDATKPTAYTGNKTITASFNKLDDKIAKDNNKEIKKPNGYKTVIFEVDDNGSILNGENTVYYVKPGASVTIEPPKTSPNIGFEPVKWDKDTTTATEYTEETTTIKGTFAKINDIVEAKEESGKVNPKPDGYVTVTFISGKNGTLYYGNASAPNTMDKKVYYVNPKTKKLEDLIKPKVKPDTGFEQKEESGKFVWDILGATNYKDDLIIDKDMIINAEYTPLDDVVPKTRPDESEKPAGYIKVTFKTTDKAGNVEKTVYVNPNKAVMLKNEAPAVTPGLGYEFAGWNRPIKETILYNDKDVITAQFNEIGLISKVSKKDYVKVEFKPGTNGSLTGTTEYWIKPGVKVTVPEPEKKADLGYKFEKWDKDLTVTLAKGSGVYEITALYTELAPVIKKTKDDDSEKPDGYVKVTFDKGDHGNLKEEKVYYVNPTKEVTLQEAPGVIADLGYKFANWDQELKQTFANDTRIKAKYDKLDNKIEKITEDQEKPSGYVVVKLIPTDNATADTKGDKIYFVNPSVPVTITREPIGKKEEVNKITYSYTFVGWRVIRGTINSWNSSSITGQFIQNTDIEAIYSVELLNIMPLPLAKDNLVTAKGEVPSAPDLIKNIPGSQEKPLPDNTTIQYAPNGEPKVDKAGNTSAELLITYPNGSTTTITVPIKVVDDVVPQIGSDKPLVPKDFVEVIVDTTDNATENTKFRKTFWVKPDTTVTLPVLAPTGKVIVEKGVRKTNQFKYWLSDNDNKKYEDKIEDKIKIKDSFSSTRLKTTITAVYEVDKNTDPEPNNGIKVPLNSKPSAKDFIKNAYDDGNPINKDNLPPGTIFEFANGDPDTSKIGEKYITTIKITYPNGEVTTRDVSYDVSGDVVEQEYGKDKPKVPDSFVRVVIKADNKFYANGNELTDEEVGELQFGGKREVDRTFWVDPTKKVTIQLQKQKAEKFTDNQHRTWSFNHWQVLDKYGNGRIYKTLNEITDKFTDIDGTYIHAIYSRDDVEVPDEKDLLITELGVQPTAEQYKANLTAPVGKTIDKVDIITPPDVSRTGMTTAKLKVTYNDTTEAEFIVKVFVKDRYDPRPSEPQIIYRDRIVEKEKIVEKIVKIKDNERLKELRYMQGYNGKFRPYDGLRRCEAAQILANALKADGYAYDSFYPISYTDIGDSWYTEAVRIVSQAGVFQGYSDGTFKPEGKITRAEWVATLRRFQDLKKVSGNDMGLSMGHWATEEIEAAYQAGWLDVYTSGIAYFDANAPITRQEVAAVSNKAFDRVLDKAYLKRNVNNMIHYKDINPSMPLYEDILCASNTLLTDGRYYKANAIDMDTLTFNIITDDLLIYQKKFQFISH